MHIRACKDGLCCLEKYWIFRSANSGVICCLLGICLSARCPLGMGLQTALVRFVICLSRGCFWISGLVELFEDTGRFLISISDVGEQQHREDLYWLLLQDMKWSEDACSQGSFRFNTLYIHFVYAAIFPFGDRRWFFVHPMRMSVRATDQSN